MDKPDVDSIEGLSPAISIEQKTASRNPRSTVGTVTEIYDYLRLLCARVGKPHCQNCGRPIAGAVGRADGRPGAGAAPRARASWCWRRSCAGARASTARSSRSCAARASCASKIDGELRQLEEAIVLDKTLQARHRGRGRPAGRCGPICASGWPTRSRPRVALGRRHRRGRDRSAATARDRRSSFFSEKLRLPDCGISMPELEPRIVLVQRPARRLPALQRPRLADGDRPRAGRARPVAVDQRGRDRAVGAGATSSYFEQIAAGGRRALRDRPRHAVGGARRRTQRDALPATAPRRRDRGHLPQPRRAQALVRDDASRASSRTSSAATSETRLRAGRARRSRSTCRCGRARRARARGCGRRRARCTVGGKRIAEFTALTRRARAASGSTALELSEHRPARSRG